MANREKIYIPAFISDQNYNPAKVLPHLYFYNSLKECERYFIQSGSSYVSQSSFPYFDNYSGLETTTSSLSLLFFNEPAVYGTTPTASLYNQYWEDYVELLYNPRTRLLNASAIIPLADYFKMELNDIVEFRGNRYHLRAINDYNLKNGECQIQLLGPIKNIDVLNIVPTIQFCLGYSTVSCALACTDSANCTTTTTTAAPTTTTTSTSTSTTSTSTTSTTSTSTTSTSTTSTSTSTTSTTTAAPIWQNGQYSSILFISGSGYAYWKTPGVGATPCVSASWNTGPVVGIGVSGQISYTVYTGSIELLPGSTLRNEIINGVAVPGVIFTPLNSGFQCGQSPLFVQKVDAITNTTSSLTIFPNTSIPMAVGDKLQYWVGTPAPLDTTRAYPPDSAITGSSVSYTTFIVPPYVFRHVWATQTFTSSGNFYYNTF